MSEVSIAKENDRVLKSFKESDILGITVMVKDGGYKVVRITAKMMGELAKSIKEKGVENIILMSETVEVVGFMVTGKQTGERIIILGKSESEEAK